ncbi:PaaI family thioesterase [Limibaculum sp. M0105]|uniref:PaaI family thioesterase n=1 Tax=Thermohalobaculum xanthum TaxID=2753746 RepID=A0A8J7M5Q3_9RHOB|nr:PaaI family thioesterase [Thermohalobaculum xanthum]MBK0398695.1 PaaI family thioesterase [Thermohalobaculum xanthum]
MEFDESLPWRRVRGEGFNAHVGPVQIARAGETVWHAALDIEPRHINVGGVCHGGVILFVADVAMGAATFESGGGHPCATIDLDCHFLAAAKRGERLLARAEQMRRVRGLSFMQCELWSGGRQVARGAGIWKYLESRAPGSTGGP